MAPFEALYDRKCRTPLNWVEPGERRYYGIDFVTEAKKQVRIILQHMKVALITSHTNFILEESSSMQVVRVGLNVVRQTIGTINNILLNS